MNIETIIFNLSLGQFGWGLILIGLVLALFFTLIMFSWYLYKFLKEEKK